MFRIFRPRAAPMPASPVLQPQLPAGRRVYAIGDCHGRSDLMVQLLAMIDAEEQARPSAETLEVVLGDMIDRGPDARGVIDALLAQPPARKRIVLRGNHEACMLRFLDDPSTFAAWRNIGGFQTLLSYGIKLRAVTTDDQFGELASDVADAIPAAHLSLLRNSAPYHIEGDYLFVHAGLRPGLPLRQQTTADLYWIREPFLSWPGDFGYHVVHGHTPVRQVDRRPNRTNVDTHAYSSGRLSCLVIENDRIDIIQTGTG